MSGWRREGTVIVTQRGREGVTRGGVKRELLKRCGERGGEGLKHETNSTTEEV